tara:strand:+ start:720 stop:1328 length:609 start_codon:yes stop_codon:yes gene_type:complete
MDFDNWSSNEGSFKEDMKRLEGASIDAIIEGTNYTIQRTGLNLRALETEYFSPSERFSSGDIHFCDEFGKSLVRGLLPMKNALISLYRFHEKTKHSLDVETLIKTSATNPPFMQVAACDSPKEWSRFINHLKSKTSNEVLGDFIDYNKFIHRELQGIKEEQTQTRNQYASRGKDIVTSVNYILGNWFHNFEVGVSISCSESK